LTHPYEIADLKELMITSTLSKLLFGTGIILGMLTGCHKDPGASPPGPSPISLTGEWSGTGNFIFVSEKNLEAGVFPQFVCKKPSGSGAFKSQSSVIFAFHGNGTFEFIPGSKEHLLMGASRVGGKYTVSAKNDVTLSDISSPKGDLPSNSSFKDAYVIGHVEQKGESQLLLHLERADTSGGQPHSFGKDTFGQETILLSRVATTPAK